MPKYDYKCECGVTELTHPISECDKEQKCPSGHLMHRIPAYREAYFWGPDFNPGVARANVGRNPHNNNRYSNYR
jgi:hypothetical protein